jgi:NifB/MoaA-like Fe-S oxidoreductase
VLEQTVKDLYQFRERILSLAIVPVGLTDHRFGLHQLRKVDPSYAIQLLSLTSSWQQQFRRELGRNFVYPSDEFYILAGREIPEADQYDGYPQIENGVGLVRSFINAFRKESQKFPKRLPSARRITLVTAELPAGFLQKEIVPDLSRIGSLEINLTVAPNTLYGTSVTVAGLLSANCIYSALREGEIGDLVLLPPEVLNADGMFLDDRTPDWLQDKLGAPVSVFGGSWRDVVQSLTH